MLSSCFLNTSGLHESFRLCGEDCFNCHAVNVLARWVRSFIAVSSHFDHLHLMAWFVTQVAVPFSGFLLVMDFCFDRIERLHRYIKAMLGFSVEA